MRLNFRHPRLATKIILWSFVPTAIILLLVALTLFFSYQQVTADFVLHRDAELTRLSAAQISAGYEDYVDRLNTLARLPVMYQGTQVEKATALKNAENQLVFFDGGVYLLNNLGILIAAQPNQPAWIGQDWSRRPYFQDLLEANEPRFSNIAPDGPDGKNIIAISVPVIGEQREFRGVLIGMFLLDSSAVSPFYGTLIKQRIGGDGTSYVLDGSGNVIYSSDFSLIGQDFNAHPGANVSLTGRFETQRITSPDGKKIVISYAPVPRSEWRLIIEEEWSDLLQSSRNNAGFLLTLLALGVIIPTIVVMIGVRAITGPVNHFIDAARNITRGDFNQSISVHTNDELEVLANQFNLMAVQLEDLYTNLEKKVADRTKQLSAINVVSEAVSRSLDLNRILPDALEKTLEVMQMDAGAIFRLDPYSDPLVLLAESGLNPNIRQLARNLPIHSSIVQAVLETKQPLARALRDYPVGDVKEILEKSGIKLVVSIPLLSKEEVLGAINVLSLSDIFPSQEELSAAAIIGQQIGVAIENARLYAQTAAYAQEMEKARQIAEEANASKSVFVANVSHELRTPLTSILGFALLVQKRLEDRILPYVAAGEDPLVERAFLQVKKNLQIIVSESQRLTAMINDILDLEKIEAGKMEWDFQPLQINEIISQATNATSSLFELTPIELIIELTENLPEIVGDREKLLQVMINLLSNAVKFTPNGRVTIQAEQQGEEIFVSVSDTGIGITADDLPRVFEKFRQVGDSLTSKPKGTGLGLPIVREIIEHHSGRVWVESTPGVGSTFWFSLPVITENVSEKIENQTTT